MTARTRILLIGVEPIMADFRRLPALNAEKIMAALNIDKAKLSDYIGQEKGRNPRIYSALPALLGLLWTALDSEMVEWRRIEQWLENRVDSTSCQFEKVRCPQRCPR